LIEIQFLELTIFTVQKHFIASGQIFVNFYLANRKTAKITGDLSFGD